MIFEKCAKPNLDVSFFINFVWKMLDGRVAKMGGDKIRCNITCNLIIHSSRQVRVFTAAQQEEIQRSLQDSAGRSFVMNLRDCLSDKAIQ